MPVALPDNKIFRDPVGWLALSDLTSLISPKKMPSDLLASTLLCVESGRGRELLSPSVDQHVPVWGSLFQMQ